MVSATGPGEINYGTTEKCRIMYLRRMKGIYISKKEAPQYFIKRGKQGAKFRIDAFSLKRGGQGGRETGFSLYILLCY